MDNKEIKLACLKLVIIERKDEMGRIHPLTNDELIEAAEDIYKFVTKQ